MTKRIETAIFTEEYFQLKEREKEKQQMIIAAVHYKYVYPRRLGNSQLITSLREVIAAIKIKKFLTSSYTSTP